MKDLEKQRFWVKFCFKLDEIFTETFSDVFYIVMEDGYEGVN